MVVVDEVSYNVKLSSYSLYSERETTEVSFFFNLKTWKPGLRNSQPAYYTVSKSKENRKISMQFDSQSEPLLELISFTSPTKYLALCIATNTM